MVAVQVDDTQEVEVFLNRALLENPLHFETIFNGITVGEDAKDYPCVPTNLVHTHPYANRM